VEWLSINFCDLCTHARIDVEVATSDSMALRDMPHDSSVTTRKTPESVLHHAPAFRFTVALSPCEWIRMRLCVHIAGAVARPSAATLNGTSDTPNRMKRFFIPKQNKICLLLTKIAGFVS
jgi:hypothetical protein